MRTGLMFLLFISLFVEKAWGWEQTTHYFERIIEKQDYKSITCVTLVEQRNAMMRKVYTGHLVHFNEYNPGVMPPPGGTSPAVLAMAGNQTLDNEYVFRLFDQNNSHSSELELLVREEKKIFAHAKTLNELHLSYPGSSVSVDPEFKTIKLRALAAGENCPSQ